MLSRLLLPAGWLASHDARQTTLLTMSPAHYHVAIGHAGVSDVTETRRLGNRGLLLLQINCQVPRISRLSRASRPRPADLMARRSEINCMFSRIKRCSFNPV